MTRAKEKAGFGSAANSGAAARPAPGGEELAAGEHGRASAGVAPCCSTPRRAEAHFRDPAAAGGTTGSVGMTASSNRLRMSRSRGAPFAFGKFLEPDPDRLRATSPGTAPVGRRRPRSWSSAPGGPSRRASSLRPSTTSPAGRERIRAGSPAARFFRASRERSTAGLSPVFRRSSRPNRVDWSAGRARSCPARTRTGAGDPATGLTQRDAVPLPRPLVGGRQLLRDHLEDVGDGGLLGPVVLRPGAGLAHPGPRRQHHRLDLGVGLQSRASVIRACRPTRSNSSTCLAGSLAGPTALRHR